MYESVVSVFDEIYPHDEYRNKLTAISTEIKKRTGGDGKVKVLDLCCGSGRGLSLFQQTQNYELHGVDINSVLLEKARRNIVGAKFYLEDVRRLERCGFQEDFFDVVIITGVSIQHFDVLDRRIIFDSVIRYLRPKGLFLMDILPESSIDNGVIIKKKITKTNEVVIFDRYSIEGRYFHRNILLKLGKETDSIEFDEFEYYKVDLQSAISESRPLHFINAVGTTYAKTLTLLFEKVHVG